MIYHDFPQREAPWPLASWGCDSSEVLGIPSWSESNRLIDEKSCGKPMDFNMQK